MEKEIRGKIAIGSIIPFILMHIVPFLMIWTGATFFDWMTCIFLYFFRMFWVTGGYHRYFSHKTYQTSRFFQFLIAFFSQTSVQKGALWWASNHRNHHTYSDTPKDPHSAKVYGFWYAHLGWILGPDFNDTQTKQIKDFYRFKELQWLNKYHVVPGFVLAVAVYLIGGYVNAGGTEGMFSAGLSSLVVGFFFSTVLLFHGTFSINSLMHIYGKPRYETSDLSKNNFILAILTMGEGWHNNHHYYQSTARQGFFWWEIDPTYYILKVFSWLGLIWDLRPVPDYIKYSKNMEHAMELQKLEEGNE